MNIESWRNQGENSKYPFVESCNLVCDNGVIIPTEFLADAMLFVPSGSQMISLTGLTVVGSNLIGTIQVDGSTLGIFTFNAASISNSSASVLDSYGISRGLVVTGSQAAMIFSVLSLGLNSIAAGNIVFESSCIFPSPLQVNALEMAGGIYSGKIAWAEGDGVKFVKLAPDQLRIDAIGSQSNAEECCQQIQGNPILKVNQAVPDQYHNIQFIMDSFSEPSSSGDLQQILQITAVPNGLIFSLNK